MRVLKIEPRKVPEIVDIPNTLEAMQEAVGGYIEAIYPFEDEVAVICNEEGKMNGSEPNRTLRDEDGRIYDILFGTFLLVGLTEDNFGSLSEKNLEKFFDFFREPKEYLFINGRVLEVPCR